MKYRFHTAQFHIVRFRTVRFHIVLAVALICAAAVWATEQTMIVSPSAHAQSDYSCATVTEIPQAECEAIIAIVDANPDARRPSNWLLGSRPCNWAGITCMDGQIVELDLRYNQLTSVPPEIGNLSALTELYLWNNQLTSLPPEIGNLSALTSLNLIFNQLTSLPLEIGNLSTLLNLSLTDNSLTSVPPEIGNLTSLTELNLDQNQLTDVPPEIGNLSSLNTLELQFNQLASVPPEIGNLSSLNTLDLANNNLASVPPEIGNLSALERLSLAGNQLTSVPPEFGNLPAGVREMLLLEEGIQIEGYLFSCTNVSEIPLIECEALVALADANPDRFTLWFYTDLPCNWVSVTCLDGRITELFLGYNELTSVPPEIGNLSALTSLFLAGNQLTSVPPELGNLPQVVIEMILEEGIQIEEYEYPFSCTNVNEIPLIECQALVALADANPDRFNLWFNNDTPCNWAAITCSDGRITELYLADNELTGVPPEIGNLSALTSLSLAGNQLTSVPPELNNLPQSVLAMILDDGIQIEEYEYLFSCTNVSEMPLIECEALVSLANANPDRFNLWFNSDVPCNWVAVTCLDGQITSLYLADNELTSVPPEIGNLSNLTSLNLYKNQLTSLPPEIGTLSNLTSLDLGDNQLTILPQELNNLPQSVLAMILNDGIQIEGYEYLFSCTNVSDILRIECEALVALADVNPDRFNVWFNTETPCKWAAIICLDGQITSLYLADNNLTSVPSEIGNLAALTSLSIGRNQLTSVPSEIGNLSALTSLHLGYNQLTSLPPAIGNLSALTYLDLRYNQLTGLPPELNNIPQLDILHVKGNPYLLPATNNGIFLPLVTR